MNKRIWIAVLGGLALVATAPALQNGAAMASTIAEVDIPPADGKLNYYRLPGGNPFCEDECTGGVCCTFPT
jgi:hypothetical protein